MSLKYKSSAHWNTLSQKGRQATDWEKVFPKHIFVKLYVYYRSNPQSILKQTWILKNVNHTADSKD